MIRISLDPNSDRSAEMIWESFGIEDDPFVIPTHCEAHATLQRLRQSRHRCQTVHTRGHCHCQEKAAGHGEDTVDCFSSSDVVVTLAHLNTEAERRRFQFNADVLTFSGAELSSSQRSSHLFALHLPLYLWSGVPACSLALEQHRVTPKGQLVLPKDLHTSLFCKQT